jgi:hypothetical protein
MSVSGSHDEGGPVVRTSSTPKPLATTLHGATTILAVSKQKDSATLFPKQ